MRQADDATSSVPVHSGLCPSRYPTIVLWVMSPSSKAQSRDTTRVLVQDVENPCLIPSPLSQTTACYVHAKHTNVQQGTVFFCSLYSAKVGQSAG